MDDINQPPRRRRGGRPPMPADQLRSATIGVRVSADEYAALRTKAEAMGMSPAQWLRTAALTRRLPPPPVPAVNVEMYGKLAGIANNLNQLTRAINAGKATAVDGELLAELATNVAALRASLLGVGGDS